MGEISLITSGGDAPGMNATMRDARSQGELHFVGIVALSMLVDARGRRSAG